MRTSAPTHLDAGSANSQGPRSELIAHLREIAARVQVDESRPDLVLQAMLNIEQYLRGVLPDLEEDPAADGPNQGADPAISC